MGKIKKILENELIGGTKSTDVYPVTSIKAVYDENNERLDNIIKGIQDTAESEVARLDEKIDGQKNEVNVAKEEALQAIAKNEQSAITNFNSQRVIPEMLSESTKQLIEASGGGTITNLADDEDITSVDDGTGSNVLKFADRTYNADNFSGKGYKILRKNIVNGNNILTQDMVNKENTIYEIRYDFDLNGAEIQVNNIFLMFNGGSISNGKIRTLSENVFLNNDKSLKNVRIIGKGYYVNEQQFIPTSNLNLPSTLTPVCDIEVIDTNPNVIDNEYNGDDGVIVYSTATKKLIIKVGDTYYSKWSSSIPASFKDVTDEIYPYFSNGACPKQGLVFRNISKNSEVNVFIVKRFSISDDYDVRIFSERRIISSYEDKKGVVTIDDDVFYTNNSSLSILSDASFKFKRGYGLHWTKAIRRTKFIGDFSSSTKVPTGARWVDKNYPVYNVLELGLKNDGVYDNWYRMQQILNDNALNDTAFFFPQGNYLFTRPLVCGMKGYRTIHFIGDNELLKNTGIQLLDYSLLDNGRSNSVSSLIFKNINELDNITFLDINNLSIQGIRIVNASVNGSLRPVESSTIDEEKPSHFKNIKINTDKIINGINTNYGNLKNVSVIGFSGSGIIVNGAFFYGEGINVYQCNTGVDVNISGTGDTRFLNTYITSCKNGLKIINGYVSLNNIWIDEMEEYGIKCEFNSDSNLRAIDFHINHCDYAGIRLVSASKCQLIGTINRCGCYYGGYNIKNVIEDDWDKMCGMFIEKNIHDSYICINSSHKGISDTKTTVYNEVSAPTIDLIVKGDMYNNQLMCNYCTYENVMIDGNNADYDVIGYVKGNYHDNIVINSGKIYEQIKDRGSIDYKKIKYINKVGNERPIVTEIGFQYFDTTINKPIWFTGTEWVDSTGVSV